MGNVASKRARTPRPARAVPSAVTVGLALAVGVLAGCSGDAPAPEPDESPSATAVAIDLTSPLDPYWAELWPDRRQNDPDPWALRAEEVVAACMAEQGFEYRIDELAGVGVTRQPDGYGTVAFAQQYGYGETIPFVEGELPRLWNEAPIGEGRAWNMAYREGLSEQARAAYDLAMDGVYADPNSPDRPPPGEYDPSLNGCRGRGNGEVFSDGMVGPAEFGEVKRAVDEVWGRVEADDRVVAALAQWSACMADAGHPGLLTTMDAESLVSTQIFEAWQQEWADQTGTNLGVTDYDVVRERIPNALAELRQAEVDLAVADATCRESSGYLATRHAVEVEIEQEVVDLYRADLDAWVTWIRENRPEG